MQYAANLRAEDEAVAGQRCRRQARRLLSDSGKLLELPAHLRVRAVGAGGEDDALAGSDGFARPHHDASHSVVFDREALYVLIGESLHRHFVPEDPRWKSSSHMTRCWRKPDSNRQYRVTEGFERDTCRLCLIRRQRKGDANESRCHDYGGGFRGTDGSNPAPSNRTSPSTCNREHLILELALLGEQKTAKVIELLGRADQDRPVGARVAGRLGRHGKKRATLGATQ